VRSAGVELSIAWSFSSHLRADLGLVFQRVRLAEPVIVFDDRAGNVIETRRLNKTAEQLGVFTLVYENPEAFDWSIGVKYLGPMHILNNRVGSFARTPSFLVIDLSVGRHFSVRGYECEVRVGARNLFDDRQRDLEAGVYRDSDYVYGPRQPRSLFVSTGLEF
jgi:outer membrane receptor for ferrienterochelin and colicins